MVEKQQMSDNQPDEHTPTMTTDEASPISQTQAPLTNEELVEEPEPAFGWTTYAETINGRFAMIGFTALLVLEILTHQSFFQWLFN